MFVVNDAIEEYCSRHSTPENPLLVELTTVTKQKTTLPQMLSGHLSGRFLTMMAQLTGARRVLEIGTFTGYSALCLAQGVVADGWVLTCEIDQKHAAIAQSFFARSPVGHKIKLAVQEAMRTIGDIGEELDLVFIDADKVNYRNYYEACLPKLRRGGYIIIDNALWSGQVLQPVDAESRAIHGLNELISRDERVESLLLPIRDGIHLVRKL